MCFACILSDSVESKGIHSEGKGFIFHVNHAGVDEEIDACIV